MVKPCSIEGPHLNTAGPPYGERCSLPAGPTTHLPSFHNYGVEPDMPPTGSLFSHFSDLLRLDEVILDAQVCANPRINSCERYYLTHFLPWPAPVLSTKDGIVLFFHAAFGSKGRTGAWTGSKLKSRKNIFSAVLGGWASKDAGNHPCPCSRPVSAQKCHFFGHFPLRVHIECTRMGFFFLLEDRPSGGARLTISGWNSKTLPAQVPGVPSDVPLPKFFVSKFLYV